MFVALTGLHASGKSYFANNIMTKYGFTVCSKKDLVKYICKEKTGRNDWAEWYSEEFNKDAKKITELILSYIDFDENIALDAVHSDLEWQIINSLIQDSEIIGIITPDYIRNFRREPGDTEKDKKRIMYWHNGGGCLLTELSWTFNGGASIEANEIMFQEFLQYMKNKQLSLQGKNIDFADNKVERLQALVCENQKLKEKIEKAYDLIAYYKSLKENSREEI